MEVNQKKLLLELVNKLKKEKRTEIDIKTTLFNAGILNKNGEFSEHYKKLELK